MFRIPFLCVQDTFSLCSGYLFSVFRIAGWNQQARPFLHNAFHIGDRLISINGQVVENARVAQKLIKHSGEHDRITFILQRTPHARVLAIKREVEGEPLGIRRQGGTAEVSVCT